MKAEGLIELLPSLAKESDFTKKYQHPAIK